MEAFIMARKLKNVICFILLFVLIFSNTVPLSANDVVASRISIFEIEGDDVTMTKGGAREFRARAGANLFEGYTVSTGRNSRAFLHLDDSSSVRVDERSSISIGQASRNRLSINVLSGGISVYAAPRATGSSFEVRAGNSALAVRGTSFVFEVSDNGNLFIIMLSGSGEVNGETINAGFVLTVYGVNEQGGHEQVITSLSLNEDLSPFVLAEIQNNLDVLIEAGVFTESDRVTVEQLVSDASTETSEPAANNNQTIIQNIIGGGGNGGGGGGTTTPTDPTIDTELLENAIADASDLLIRFSNRVSTSGEGIPSPYEWVRESDINALTNALDVAEAALRTVRNADEVSSAALALENAINTFETSIQTGVHAVYINNTPTQSFLSIADALEQDPSSISISSDLTVYDEVNVSETNFTVNSGVVLNIRDVFVTQNFTNNGTVNIEYDGHLIFEAGTLNNNGTFSLNVNSENEGMYIQDAEIRNRVNMYILSGRIVGVPAEFVNSGTIRWDDGATETPVPVDTPTPWAFSAAEVAASISPIVITGQGEGRIIVENTAHSENRVNNMFGGLSFGRLAFNNENFYNLLGEPYSFYELNSGVYAWNPSLDNGNGGWEIEGIGFICHSLGADIFSTIEEAWEIIDEIIETQPMGWLHVSEINIARDSFINVSPPFDIEASLQIVNDATLTINADVSLNNLFVGDYGSNGTLIIENGAVVRFTSGMNCGEILIGENSSLVLTEYGFHNLGVIIVTENATLEIDDTTGFADFVNEVSGDMGGGEIQITRTSNFMLNGTPVYLTDLVNFDPPSWNNRYAILVLRTDVHDTDDILDFSMFTNSATGDMLPAGRYRFDGSNFIFEN
jgi:hypothetical protein